MLYTGLLNKKKEGCGEVKPQYQAVSIWEIMENIGRGPMGATSTVAATGWG
jgi:hypothetical protein